jgi:biopolymer transport protein ExbB
MLRRLLLCCALLLPSVALAWWNNEWNFRKEITLDLGPAGGDIAATATDVPVLLRLSLGNFAYFGDVKPDGSDFRVIAGDDKTPLKFHVERFDPVNQLAYLWVKVPQLTGGAATDKIFLYYGNPAAPNAADAAGSFDASQLLVLHFGETEGNPLDATAYANKVSASTAQLVPASLIGGGAQFAGASTITLPATPSLRLLPAKGMTLSAWVRIEGPQGDAVVMAMEEGAKALVLGIDGLVPFATLADGAAPPVPARAAAPLVAGQWHHLAVSVGGGQLALHVDGVEVAAAPATAPEIAGTLTIGGSAAGGRFLSGTVDEVQAASAARPPQFIRAQARGQGADSTLVVYGADAQREGEETSYFATTMRNVTIDGWIVIGILAVMFLISMLVIVAKAIMLSRIRKANRAFMKEFEKLGGDLTALDRTEADDSEADEAIADDALVPYLGAEDGRFHLSTLYRLYHHGVSEVQKRIGTGAVGAQAVTRLSSQSIEAVKAALDATMVRMTQKLQARMVLLTIAISGGPFLGLLGTVIGVMITFAAIAASGDVNVNAIAPGIAAALAATVAGLAVAIPALFGYNWLNTVIKEINADMRVFVDEFVAQVAERYS